MSLRLPPAERTILAPEGGWKERAYYAVEVAWSKHNVIHKGVFYAGFLKDGEPSGYNQVWNPTYETPHPAHLWGSARKTPDGEPAWKDISNMWMSLYPFSIDKAHYLKVLGELPFLSKEE